MAQPQDIPTQSRPETPPLRAVSHVPVDGDGLAALRRENAELREALTSRAVIDQAKGVLILRYGIDQELAFLVLQQWSREQSVSIRCIAESLVHGICQGRQGDAFDAPLMRWLEEQLRKDPEGISASP
jgi:ANTAR domain